MVINLEENSRGRAIADMLVCSLAGVMVSAFAFVPSILCMTQSLRFDNASSAGYFDIIRTILCDFPEQKYFMYFAGEVGVGGVVYVCVKGKTQIRKYADSLIMILLLSAPVLLDSIDLLWSGGSYMHFPMRFGYMLSFELIVFSVKLVVAKSDEQTENDRKKREYLSLGSIILLPVAGVMTGILCNKFRLHGIRDLSAYKGYGVILLVMIVLALLLFLSENKKLIQYVLIAVAVVQAICGMYGLIAPEGDFSLECGDGFVIAANEVYENMEKQDDLNRIKDRDILLNANYGLILNQSSLGSWMNGASPGIQEQMRRMGYTINYTRILDGCGTAFTDAVLGIRRLYGKEDLNSDLYSNQKDVGEGYIYDCNYQLPFGMVIGDGDIEETEGFDYQNALFGEVTGLDEQLIEEVDISNASKEIFDREHGIYIFDKKIEVDNKAILYLYAKSSDDNKYSFVINDMQVPLDAQGSEGNVMYTQFFLNGILEMGTYENEIVDLKVLTELESLDNVHVGLMKLDTLSEGVERVNQHNQSITSVKDGKLIMEFTSDHDGILFLPIGYYDDYDISMDGEEKAYFPFLGDAFVGMEICKGNHSIVLDYKTEGLRLGLLISAAGIMLAVALAVARDRNMAGMITGKILVYMYRVIICIMIVVLYVIPIIGSIAVLGSAIGRLV